LGESLGLKLVSVLEKPLKVAELEAVFERLQAAGQPMSAERLLEGITNDELSLDFQPIVTRDPKTILKLEALARWDHPVMGRIAPGEFLPVGEGDAAIMDVLTDWAVSSVVEAYQVLAELGVRVPLSVNVSPHNLYDLTFPDRIEQRMRAGGMPAHLLCLEITESDAFKDTTRSTDILTRVRLKGMQISIDDFGTGYSSLKMLRLMPNSEIKIDQLFVGNLTTSRDSRAIVKSIINLASSMEMSCVAEGVETEETAEQLEQLGACSIQGFLIAPPMPVEAVPAWLAIWSKCGGTAAPKPEAADSEVDVLQAPLTTRIAVKGKSGERLSPRQLDVIRLLSVGLSVKEIARELKLGAGTVKVHLSLAYSALGARNRIEAVMLAADILAQQRTAPH
jgi:EAL domain-containing protein (putative c-di-GMP-specific phosphodiesterase class I)/DNA-binding CsgD family transcriptional regulator